MSVEHFVPVHPVDDGIFHWINENSDFLVTWMKSQRITKVSKIHPLGTVDMCTKFHGSPLKTKKCLMVSLGQKSGYQQSQ